MSDIRSKIVTWSESDRVRAEKVYKRAEKHVNAALLDAYRVINPSLENLPQDVLANERRKFAYIAKGNFPAEYFDQQAVITANIASSLDFATYLSRTYAAYAAGLASGLMKERSLFDKDSDALMLSLMRSVFSDASVVMANYFEILTAQADAEREAVEAERRAVAAEQATVVGTMAASLARLAQGDLTTRIETEFNGEYAQIKADFNAAATHLQDTMGVVVANVSAIRSGANEISQAADDLSRRTEQQAASLEETAAALDEITATVKRTASGARQASDTVLSAKGDAETSGNVVRDAVTAMGAIEKSSQEISQIIGVIDEIAFQTNLLALNAGVEAARAGDAGRGFAVVASEVRALAQRSAEAAKEIKVLISASSIQVNSGVGLVGQTGEALQRIVSRVAEIDELVSEIAASAQEQATGLQEVNTAVNQMDQVTQQNAAMVEQSTAASHSLSQEAESLSQSVSRFEIGSPAHGGQSAARNERRPASPSHRPVVALRTVGRNGVAHKPQLAAVKDSWEAF